MLWNHSFRKANISVAVAATVLIVGFVTFGHRSDIAYQLLVLGSFAVMVATLFALYRHEERRRE